MLCVDGCTHNYDPRLTDYSNRLSIASVIEHTTQQLSGADNIIGIFLLQERRSSNSSKGSCSHSSTRIYQYTCLQQIPASCYRNCKSIWDQVLLSLCSLYLDKRIILHFGINTRIIQCSRWSSVVVHHSGTQEDVSRYWDPYSADH